MADTDVVRALAAWALVHEMADEGWKAAVSRGLGETAQDSSEADVVDGISALVYREKERLREALAGMGETVEPPAEAEAAEREELRFELAEMRGRLEAIEAALDALVERLDSSGSAGG